jgi:hypothetical protein
MNGVGFTVYFYLGFRKKLARGVFNVVDFTV